jgi:beta-alanine degradation protein BauB
LQTSGWHPLGAAVSLLQPGFTRGGDKMAGVGTEKVFENDKVIVWNFVLEPGAETPMHTHEHNYMWYAIAGAPLQVFDENGKDLGTLEVPTGAVYSLKLDNGFLEVLSEPGKGMRVPARHKARNVGRTAYREVLVEYK